MQEWQSFLSWGCEIIVTYLFAIWTDGHRWWAWDAFRGADAARRWWGLWCPGSSRHNSLAGLGRMGLKVDTVTDHCTDAAWCWACERNHWIPSRCWDNHNKSKCKALKLSWGLFSNTFNRLNVCVSVCTNPRPLSGYKKVYKYMQDWCLHKKDKSNIKYTTQTKWQTCPKCSRRDKCTDVWSGLLVSMTIVLASDNMCTCLNDRCGGVVVLWWLEQCLGDGRTGVSVKMKWCLGGRWI